MNTNIPDILEIPEECHGQRLDQVMAKLYPDYSRTRWAEWIKSGKLQSEGTVLKTKDKLSYGQVIHINIEPEKEPRVSDSARPQPIDLAIVYEDEFILVINKPAGLVVHPGAGNADNTILNALLYHYPDAQNLIRAGIVHRLDKETSGLMVIAKTAAAQTRLIEQLQQREITREYTCLVYGHLISGGEVETFYGRHPRNRLKMAVLSSGKEALSYYFIERQFQDFTLLRVKLASGRTHQIRVHMEYIKHPLVGDPLYGNRLKIPQQADQSLIDQLRNFKRQALHACQLTFNHPLTDEKLAFQAPLPTDFSALLNALEQHYGNHSGRMAGTF